MAGVLRLRRSPVETAGHPSDDAGDNEYRTQSDQNGDGRGVGQVVADTPEEKAAFFDGGSGPVTAGISPRLVRAQEEEPDGACENSEPEFRSPRLNQYS